MKLSSLKIDSSAIEAGRWVDTPGLNGVQFQVRGLGNADYRRLSAKLNDSVPRDKRVGGRVEPAEADKIVLQLILDTVLLDWRGLTDDAYCSAVHADTAKKLFGDPAYRVLRESVLATASMVASSRRKTRRPRTKLAEALVWTRTEPTTPNISRRSPMKAISRSL